MNELSEVITDTIGYAKEGIDAFGRADLHAMSEALFTIYGAMLHAQVVNGDEVTP